MKNKRKFYYTISNLYIDKRNKFLDDQLFPAPHPSDRGFVGGYYTNSGLAKELYKVMKYNQKLVDKLSIDHLPDEGQLWVQAFANEELFNNSLKHLAFYIDNTPTLKLSLSENYTMNLINNAIKGWDRIPTLRNQISFGMGVLKRNGKEK